MVKEAGGEGVVLLDLLLNLIPLDINLLDLIPLGLNEAKLLICPVKLNTKYTEVHPSFPLL